MTLMKTQLIILLVLITVSRPASAQIRATDIVGVWLSEEQDGKVEIYQQGERFFGKLIWGKEMYEQDGVTSKKDVANPDANLAKRPLKDLVILNGFVFEDGQWLEGTIYDPQSGKTYKCEMKLSGDKLHIRGYIGITLFGRTTVWTRTKR